MNTRVRSGLLTLFKLGITLGGLAYVFWAVDPGALLARLQLFRPALIVGMTGIVLLSLLPMILRLDYLSNNMLGFKKAAQATFVGQGMNNILPAKLGEAVKIFYISSASGIPRSSGVELVFWERFADLNILLALAGYALWFTGRNMFLLPLLGVVSGVWGGLFMLRWAPGLSLRLIGLVPWERLRRLLLQFQAACAGRFQARFFAVLTAYSLVFWALAASVMGLGFLAANAPLALPQWLAVFVISSLGLTLPGAPGGLGVYEAAVVGPALWFGVDKETAVALAVVLRAVQYIPVTFIGLVALQFSGLRLKSFT